MNLRSFNSLRALLFTWKSHWGLEFHFGQTDRSEICTEMSFTLTKLMWTLVMKLAYTDVKFHPEVNWNRFEISNCFKMSFYLHGNFTVSNLEISNRFKKLSSLNGDFTAATFKTIARLYCTCVNDVF